MCGIIIQNMKSKFPRCKYSKFPSRNHPHQLGRRTIRTFAHCTESENLCVACIAQCRIFIAQTDYDCKYKRQILSKSIYMNRTCNDERQLYQLNARYIKIFWILNKANNALRLRKFSEKCIFHFGATHGHHIPKPNIN